MRIFFTQIIKKTIQNIVSSTTLRNGIFTVSFFLFTPLFTYAQTKTFTDFLTPALTQAQTINTNIAVGLTTGATAVTNFYITTLTDYANFTTKASNTITQNITDVSQSSLVLYTNALTPVVSGVSDFTTALAGILTQGSTILINTTITTLTTTGENIFSAIVQTENTLANISNSLTTTAHTAGNTLTTLAISLGSEASKLINSAKTSTLAFTPTNQTASIFTAVGNLWNNLWTQTPTELALTPNSPLGGPTPKSTEGSQTSLSQPPPSLGGPTPKLDSTSPTTIITRNITQPVITRTVERVLFGITAKDLENHITTLRNELLSEIAKGNTKALQDNNSLYLAMAPMNRINNLSSVTISSPTITSASITNSSFSGSSGAFSGDISAVNATLSGALSSASGIISGIFTAGSIGVGTSSPYTALSVVGETVSSYFTTNSTTATSTFVGRLLVTKIPSIAHTGSWNDKIANFNVLDSTLLVNPVSATGDSNLIGLAVNGSVKFIVDAEGDVFANALTVTGSTTQGATTISTLTVEADTQLGDAVGDVVNFSAGTINFHNATTANFNSATIFGLKPNTNQALTFYGTTTPTIPLLSFDTATQTVGIGTTSPYAKLSVWGNDTGATSIFELTNSASTSLMTVLNNGNVGIGTTSPYATLSVVGNIAGVTSMTMAGLLMNTNTTEQLRLGYDSSNYTSFTVGATGGVTEQSGQSALTGTTNDAFLFNTTNTLTTANLFRFRNNSVDRLRLDGNGVLTHIPKDNPGTAQALTITALGTNQTAKGISITGTSLGTISKAYGIEMNIEEVGNGSRWMNLLGKPNGGITMTHTGTGNPSFKLIVGTMDSVTSSLGGAMGVSMSSAAVGFGGYLYHGVISATTTGTAKFLKFDAASNVEKFSVDLNGQGYFAGNVGIGTTSPYAKLSVVGEVVASYFTATTTTATSTILGKLSVGRNQASASVNGVYFSGGLTSWLEGAGVDDVEIGIGRADGTTATAGSMIFGGRSRGSFATPTIVNDGDNLLTLQAVGHDGTDFAKSALIAFDVDGTPGANVMPGRITFSTSPASSQTPLERMRITSAGNVGIGTTSPYAKLSVVGQIVGSYFTATSTTATSTFTAGVNVGAGNGYFIGGTNILSYNSGSGQFNVGLNTNTSSGVTMGNGNDSSDSLASAVGYGNTANGFTATAFGYSNGSFGLGSSAFGHANSAAANSSSAFGDSNEASGVSSSAFGSSNIAMDDADSAVGYSNTAGGYSSSAFGHSNIASSYQSVAFGFYNQATTTNAVALGSANQAGGGDSSVAVGRGNKAWGQFSIAIGANITNTTANSLMIGPSDTAKLTILSSGNVGIGTTTPFSKLTVVGTTTIGSLSTAVQAGINIGFGGLCVDNDGSCVASTTGRISAISYTTGATDLAENYTSALPLEAGDIVMTAGGDTVSKADGTGTTIGIVSTNPGIILGLNNENENPNHYPVALSGRVPVKVNTENGLIKKGDRITLSSISGIGTKATATSTITVGIALDDFDGTTILTGATTTATTVLAFVNLSNQDASLNLENLVSLNARITDASGEKTFVGLFFDRMIAWFADAGNGIGEVVANVFRAKEKICVDDQCLTKEDIRKLLLLTRGQSESTTPVVTTTTTAITEVIIQGNNPQTITIGTIWGDLGATASSTDADIANFGITTFLDGIQTTTASIDTTATSTHTITYKVMDGSTGTIYAEATREVNVIE